MNELGTLFQNYQTEAFRLELLPQYKVDGEWENYQKFLNDGEVNQDEDLKSYLKDVELKIKSGASHVRARVLTEPINQYQIFETKVGYIPSKKLGTHFYFIGEFEYERLMKERFGADFTIRDFWLFDNTSVAFMVYDNEGRWKGFEIGSKDDVLVCLEMKNLVKNNSYGIKELLQNLNL